MLSGEYKHSCDEKYRLRLPAKFKKELNEYVITKGTDGCLFVLSNDAFSKLLAKTTDIPMFNAEVQKPLRMLYSSAYEVEEDNQGRFLLPASLREFANIIKDVVFVGVGTRVELWAGEKWEAYKQGSDNYDEVVKKLGEYGI